MRRRATPAPKRTEGPSAQVATAVARRLELESRSFEDEVRSNPNVIDLRFLASRFVIGLHVSPWRDDQGRLVIVRIDADGRLASMWPVTGIADDWQLSVDPGTRRIPSRVTPDRDLDLEDFTIHNTKDRELGEQHATGGWARGAVFVCPWKGMLHPDTAMLAITDRNGCVRALVEVDPEDTAAVLDWPLAFLSELLTGSMGAARQPFAYFDGGRAS
jgi:hypothetical protein